MLTVYLISFSQQELQRSINCARLLFFVVEIRQFTLAIALTETIDNVY